MNDAKRLAELIRAFAATAEAEENGNDMRPRTARKILREACALAKKVLDTPPS